MSTMVMPTLAPGYEVREIPAKAPQVAVTAQLMHALTNALMQILGCTVLGIEGGEIMSMLQIAMMGKLPYTVLQEAIFAHPTLAEGLNNVFLSLDRQAAR